MDTVLNQREARVLGCLIEKAMTTPDYYPLSLNALTLACNQKSNREPIVAWDETEVQETLASLEKKGLVNRSTMGRVPKFEETYTRQHHMVASEAAVVCVLLLRGPQTPGAIRTRTERLYAFDSLEDLQATLDRLDEWGQICRLDRLPGHKESRYDQLLTGEPNPTADGPDPLTPQTPVVDPDRIARLESTVEWLKDELAELRAAFDAFRQQFD